MEVEAADDGGCSDTDQLADCVCKGVSVAGDAKGEGAGLWREVLDKWENQAGGGNGGF